MSGCLGSEAPTPPSGSWVAFCLARPLCVTGSVRQDSNSRPAGDRENQSLDTGMVQRLVARWAAGLVRGLRVWALEMIQHLEERGRKVVLLREAEEAF